MKLELFPATLTEKSAVCVDEQGMNTYFTIPCCTMCCIFKYDCPVEQSTFFDFRFVSAIDKHIII